MAKIRGMTSVSTEGAVAQNVVPLEPPAFKLSPQQEAILTAVHQSVSNLIIEARAGTGKTSTLIEVCKYLGQGAIFLAFNKAIATEVGQKLASAGIGFRDVKASTFHAVGFQAWMRHAPASGKNVRGEKLSILAEKLGMPRKYQPFCTKAVSLAKQALVGAVPDLPIDDTEVWGVLVEHYSLLDLIPSSDEEVDEEEFLEFALSWSLKLLRSSIDEAVTMIDFDDMIYMPIYCGLRFWQYKWVLIDEAQDTNRARREIAKRLLAPGGRLIAVGDRHQAIYGFTGADSDALDLIQDAFACELLPLTVTYRCPKAVVRLAQEFVPDIEHRPDAPEGSVTALELDAFMKLVPEPTDAIICRNMKPLVEIAFGYLRRRIGCHIEGKEIGAGLISFCRKWKSAVTVSDLMEKLSSHLEVEREKLLSQHKESMLAALEDRIDTLIALADGLPWDAPVEDLVKLINQLFKDSDGLVKQTITLSTIHKSKGREWDRVYLLGRNAYMPSPFATRLWQQVQEANLAYVAITRAKAELIEVVVPTQKRRR